MKTEQAIRHLQWRLDLLNHNHRLTWSLQDRAAISHLLIETQVTASEDALNDICTLLDAPDWEYPGQVVRDVALAIKMSFADMAMKLSKAKEEVDIAEEMVVAIDNDLLDTEDGE